MRSLTNTLAFLSGVLLMVIFMLYSMPAKAQEPDATEQAFILAYEMYPERREEIIDLYWKEMQSQVNDLRAHLPMQTSAFQIVQKYDIPHPRTIVIEYLIRADVASQIDWEKLEARQIDDICNGGDESLKSMHTRFQGSKVYVYWVPGHSVPLRTVTFGSNVCDLVDGV